MPSKIEEALKRSAELDARRITVEVDGGQVRLWQPSVLR
jgi:osmotically-inducible protein OsmY